jgi:hypothetical protein
MRRLTILALAVGTAAACAALATAAPPAHRHDMATMGGATSQALAAKLADARLATAKYATNLALAKKQGYGVITQMIPDMGWHFLNPKITKFDITKPAKLPLPGATYGSFGAACHYKDGTFVFQADQDACTAKSPQSGAAFNFWHPDLVTLHVWAWYPNPDGVFSGMNPLMRPFNKG